MLYENTTFFTDQYLTLTINIEKDIDFNSDWSSSSPPPHPPFFFFFFFLFLFSFFFVVFLVFFS